MLSFPKEFKLEDGRVMVLEESTEIQKGSYLVICLDLKRKFDVKDLNKYPAKIFTIIDEEILELIKIKELVVDIVEF